MNKDYSEETKYKEVLLELEGVRVLELYLDTNRNKWFLVKVDGNFEWREA